MARPVTREWTPAREVKPPELGAYTGARELLAQRLFGNVFQKESRHGRGNVGDAGGDERPHRGSCPLAAGGMCELELSTLVTTPPAQPFSSQDQCGAARIQPTSDDA
jgi:hypothetical protein